MQNNSTSHQSKNNLSRSRGVGRGLVSVTVALLTLGCRADQTTSVTNLTSGSAVENRAVETTAIEHQVLVFGTVRSENGASFTSRTINLLQDADGGLSPEPRYVRRAQSTVNSKGGYSLKGPAGNNYIVEFGGIIRGISDADVSTTAPEPRVRTVRQDITLPALHTLEGSVSDEQGNPVGGARVKVASDDIMYGAWEYAEQVTSTTANGQFTFSLLSEGEATLGASVPGLLPAASRISIPTSGPLTITLTTGSKTLAGKVVKFSSGEPVEGALVTVLPGENYSRLNLESNKVTTSGADGSFSFSGLSSDPLSFGVTHPAWNNTWLAPGTGETPVDLGDVGSTEVRLIVFPGYTIKGRVVDLNTSRPLAGVAIRVGEDSSTSATTDDNGNYEIKDITPNASAMLRARYPGYAAVASPSMSTGSDGAFMNVPMPADTDVVTQYILMAPASVVSGQVVDQGNARVAEANVTWRSTREIGGAGITTATDAAGNFSLEVTPGEEGVLEVSAPGYTLHKSVAMVRASGVAAEPVVLRLEKSGLIEGRVVDELLQAVPQAAIMTTDTVALGQASVTNYRVLGTTGPDGEFSLSTLPAGEIILLARKGGKEGTITVRVTPGEAVKDVRLNIR